METIPFWKKVWQTVSGNCKTVTETNISELLGTVKQDILAGLGTFSPHSTHSYKSWKAIVKTGDNSALDKLIKRISLSTDLDTRITWRLFCNYLMFEYHGKIEDIQQLVNFEMYTANLIENFAHFYTMERMFCLKTLRHILDNYNNNENPYRRCYADFVTSVGVQTIRAGLIKQLQQLHDDICSDNKNNVLDLKKWIQRNLNEQVELFLMLIATTYRDELDMEDFQALATLCRKCNYGISPLALELLNTEQIDRLRSVAVGSILVCYTHFWDNFSIWENHHADLDAIFVKGGHQLADGGVIVLAWSVLQTTHPDHQVAEIAFEQKYQKFIALALEANVLKCLATFAGCDVFLGLKEDFKVCNAIYQLVDTLCVKVYTNDGLYTHHGSVALLSQLMRHGALADRIIDQVNIGIGQMLTTVERMFPLDFESFTTIMQVLVTQDNYSDIIVRKLQNLQYFMTAEYSDVTITGGYMAIRTAYKPLRNDLVIVPPNAYATQYTRFSRHVLVFQTQPYRYFDILNYLIQCALGELPAAQHDVAKAATITPLMRVILTGLNLLCELIARDVKVTQQQCVSKCLNHVWPLFIAVTGKRYNHEMVLCCFKLCMRLMPISSTQIMHFLTLNHIMPTMSTDDFKSGKFYEANMLAIGELQTRIMETDIDLGGRHQFVTLFIDMMKFGMGTCGHFRRIQMPLAVYLFQRIFPVHLLWKYDSPHAKNTICLQLLTLLHDILQKDLKDIRDEMERKLYEHCLHVVLHHEGFIKAFVMVYRCTNGYLEDLMSCEADWETGRTRAVLRTAQLCVSIVLLAVRVVGGAAELQKIPFGRLFGYSGVGSGGQRGGNSSSASGVNSMKVLAGFMNQCFVPSISEAACRLLTKFAQNSNIPMLAHLEMDSYQVRGMFLEKLRDPLEPASIKVAIVDLITVCVTSQNGLTAAFFDVLKRRKDKSKDFGENVLSFITEFLKNLQKSDEYLKCPLQEAVLNLLYKLWHYNKAILIKPLIELENFWTMLTHPLFTAQLHLEDLNYSRIIDILSMELSKLPSKSSSTASIIVEIPTTENSLIHVLSRMFSDEKFTEKILNHCCRSLKQQRTETNNAKTDLCLLTSVRNFLLLAISKTPQVFGDDRVKCSIANHCLYGILDHFKSPYDSKVLTLWSDIYLYAISAWQHNCYTNYDKELAQLVEIFTQLNKSYHVISTGCKENLVTIACKTVQFLKDIIEREPETIQALLETIRAIMRKEHECLYGNDNYDGNIPEMNCTWMLLIVFTNQLLQIESVVAMYKLWFFNSGFVTYVLGTVGVYMNRVESLPVAKIAVQTLLNYARTDMWEDFEALDLERFYDSIRPRKEYLDIGSYDFKAKTAWPYEDWWLAYTGVVQLNVTLLRRDGLRFLRPCCTYLCMHREVISAVMKLPACTVELSALGLVQSLLDLGHAMMEHRYEWREHDGQSLAQFFVLVNQCMNSCIQIMLTPKILKFFSFKNLQLTHVEQVPSSVLVSIMDNILQIITMACFCYNKATPTPLELMEYVKINLPYRIDIECDFSVPRISNVIQDSITYGNMLCLVQILCKILFQIQKVDLNTTSEHNTTPKTPPCAKTTATDSPKLPPPPEPSTSNMEQLAATADETLVGFVCPDLLTGYTITDTMKRIAEHEISGLSAPWLARLDSERTAAALDALVTVLASQVYLLSRAWYDGKISDYQYIRRDLSAELQVFHDHVRKYVTRKYKYAMRNNVLVRGRYVRRKPEPVITIMAPRTSKFSNKYTSTVLPSLKEPSTSRATVTTPVGACGDFIPLEEEAEEEVLLSVPSPGSSSPSTSSSSAWGIASDMNITFPDAFLAWRDSLLTDCHFQPCFPTEVIEFQAEPVQDDEYLMMISHWFLYTCQLSD